jgi:hypothetical protein
MNKQNNIHKVSLFNKIIRMKFNQVSGYKTLNSSEKAKVRIA